MARNEETEFYQGMLEGTLNVGYTPGVSASIDIDAPNAQYFDPSGLHWLGVWMENFYIPGESMWISYSTRSGTTPMLLGGLVEGAFGGPTFTTAQPAGHQVKVLPVYTGQPISLMLRILASTGLGTNGPYDVYQKNTGLGLPQTLFDRYDAEVWRDRRGLIAALSAPMSFAFADPPGNGLGFFQERFSRYGFWYVQRQGQLSCRAAMRSSAIVPAFEITDDDIAFVDSFEWWSTEQPVEYAELAIAGNNLTTVGTVGEVDTRPGLKRATIDITDLQHVSGEESTVASDIFTNTEEWWTQIPRPIRLTLRGWHWAQMVPGDWTYLTTDRIGPPLKDSGGYRNERAMVTQVTPFVGPYTQVTIQVLPNEPTT